MLSLQPQLLVARRIGSSGGGPAVLVSGAARALNVRVYVVHICSARLVCRVPWPLGGGPPGAAPRAAPPLDYFSKTSKQNLIFNRPAAHHAHTTNSKECAARRPTSQLKNAHGHTLRPLPLPPHAVRRSGLC